jgi:nickel-type superoxide dismutase maturation protease
VGHRQATRYSAVDNNRAQRPIAVAVAVTAAVAATVAVAALTARWAWSRSERTEVSGDSMVPTLQPGDRLVVWRTKRFRPGDIVAAGDPRHPARTVLKRAATVDPEWIFLVGDNEMHSTDSRHFGPVPLGLVRGKAVYRYAPPGRTGRLRPKGWDGAKGGDH